MSLLDNQSKAKEHLNKWKVGALFMEAGTGKTRVAIELANSTDCDLIVWVGPLRTISSIKEEVTKWGGFKADSAYYGIESIQGSDRIYFEVMSKLKGANKPFIIVDESLKMKNADAKRTKRMLELSKLAEYKLILNGTPITKNIMDMWSQMEFLSPKILNMNVAEFKNTFCKYTIVTKNFGGRKSYTKEFITGFDNIDYLYSLIRNYIYECDLKLNITQNYEVLRYNISESEKESYNEIKSKFLDNEEMTWRNNNIFLSMTQKMQHSYCCSESKFDLLDMLFKEIPQEKSIIFCKYIDSRESCEKKYPKAKVLSYQKESLGLNLQEYNHTIYFDKNWDYALRIQSSRRTYRTGQEYNCKYYDLTGDVGLETLIDLNISKKLNMTEYFKNKTKEQIKEEL
ncbi:MAG: SNF2-related protein [Phocaeicola sp.]